jgi:hypothetical protein
MTELGFGKYYTGNSLSFKNIKNDNDNFYGNATDMAIFSVSLQGLGLPPQSFESFYNLLSIETNGEASCSREKGGKCVLSRSCASYPDLWDYSFKVAFGDGNGNFIMAPITTFAQEAVWQNQQICHIYVHYLPSKNSDDWTNNAVVFGLMFWQTIYLQIGA